MNNANKTPATIVSCGTGFTFKGGEVGSAILWWLIPAPLHGERSALGFAETPIARDGSERPGCDVITIEQARAKARTMGYEVAA